MQDNTNPTPINPLKLEEFESTRQEFFVEVDSNILRFIRRMGLSKSLQRLIEKLVAEGHYIPSIEQVKVALIDDLALHTRILEGVFHDFYNAVAKQKVDRDHVGGWLNRTSQRKTWKLAIPRARQLLRELQPYSAGTEEIANMGGYEDSAEGLLLLRQFADRYAEIIAALSIEERQLFDAKIAGQGYASLAAARGTTTGALKAEVCRLCQKIARLVRQEHGLQEDRLSAEEDPTKRS